MSQHGSMEKNTSRIILFARTMSDNKYADGTTAQECDVVLYIYSLALYT